MDNKTQIITILCAAFLLFIGLIGFLIQNQPDKKELAAFDRKFSQLEIGDQERKVISLLGDPDSKIYQAGTSGVEIDNSTQYYLFWVRGSDFMFTIGINSKGLVSSKDSGGTY